MSNELRQTLDALIKVRDNLYIVINDKTKLQEVRVAALGEYDEVALRVRTLLARDLEKDVTGLDSLALKITQGHKEVTEAINGAKVAADVVKSVSKFLGFVDELIDKAKVLLAFL